MTQNRGCATPYTISRSSLQRAVAAGHDLPHLLSTLAALDISLTPEQLDLLRQWRNAADDIAICVRPCCSKPEQPMRLRA